MFKGKQPQEYFFFFPHLVVWLGKGFAVAAVIVCMNYVKQIVQMLLTTSITSHLLH